MTINFGKHFGKSPELLLLRDPDYVLWMLSQKEATGRFREAQDEVRQLIRAFDRKAILESCQNPGCRKPATRATVYKGSLQLRWWCDECDPAKESAVPGKLEVLRTFLDAAAYVSNWCSGRKPDLEVLIRKLARAKGLPDRVGERQACAFFR